MANICTTNYVIEGKKEELDALYQKMKELQGQDLGQLVEALGKNPDEIMCR
jgi:metal-responsive CopG/Arc/MetJ family transcriptional regulator